MNVSMFGVALVSMALILPVQASATPYHNLDRNTKALVTMIYNEAGIEDYECKLLVGKTAINRVGVRYWKSKKTLHAVIYQKAQYSFTYAPQKINFKSTTYKDSLRAAKWLLNNPDVFVTTADHYINHDKSNAKWWRKMQHVTKCGVHDFYK